VTKAFIVFSGYNQRAVVAFLRTLSKHDIPFGIIATGKDDSIFLTDYSRKVISTRESLELDPEEITGHIKKVQTAVPAEGYIIAPSTEALNRFLLSNIESFKNENCEVPLADKSQYEKISDKTSFTELCRQNGIQVPAEYRDFQSAPIPIVAKPKTYFASNGDIHTPVIIQTQKDKESFEKKYNLADFYYQEFVEGCSYYLLYYFHKDGTCEKLSQKNLMQQPQGKSIVAAVTSDIHRLDVSNQYEKLFNDAGFRGLVMVEIKGTKNNNFMIEANPRFWGPSQLFVDSGPDLFESFLKDYSFNVTPAPANVGEHKYFWYGGYQEVIRAGGKITYYDYSLHQFNSEKQDWLAADVYNREDTRKLFDSEAAYDY
jgi:predicted ATP-grasp superfamily ATP-dependent carboligase